MVFSLDDYRVEKSDYEEGRQTNDDTDVIHICSNKSGKFKKLTEFCAIP